MILSAGVYNSAQLLMLSGIGPREHVASLNIPLVTNLPVGQNFMDQTLAILDYLVGNASDVTVSGAQNQRMTVQNLYQLYANAGGPLANGLMLTPLYLPSGINGDQDFPDGTINLMVIGYRKYYWYCTRGHLKQSLHFDFKYIS